MARPLVDFLNADTVSDFFTSRNSLLLPSGNLGIPRNKMPQIVDFERFKRILERQKVDFSTVRRRIGSVKLAQNEVNTDKVYKMMLKYRSKNKRTRGGVDFSGFPPVITKDGYVLDGLHRQVAMFNINRHAYHNYTMVEVGFKSLYKYLRNNPGRFAGVVEYKPLVD